MDPKAVAYDLILDLYGQVRGLGLENEQLRQEIERLTALVPKEAPEDVI